MKQQNVPEIAAAVVDFAKTKGALYMNFKDGKEIIDHVPLALLPYKLHKSDYEKLQKVQEIWGRLLAKLGEDREFIEKTLEVASQHDDFILKFLEIYKRTRDHKPQPVSYHAIRSDYMRDSSSSRYLLI